MQLLLLYANGQTGQLQYDVKGSLLEGKDVFAEHWNRCVGHKNKKNTILALEQLILELCM